MVKIEGTSTYAASRLRKKTSSKKTPDSFSIEGQSSASESSSAQDAQSPQEIASLTQLMSLQEVTTQDPNHKKILDDGESILQSLDSLQTQILSGKISKASLTKIVSMTGSLPAIADPNLKAIIAEIRQRAMIEIAKIEMSTGESIL